MTSTRKTTMKTLLLSLGALALSGCGAEPTGPAAAVTAAALDGVRGCETAALPPGMRSTVHAVSGVEDLFLVRVGGRALCADSAAGVRSLLQDLAPFDARVLNASNPMPGSDPNASNPMPGSDPNASNPMPGDNPNAPSKS
jgi:hypothetical protein